MVFDWEFIDGQQARTDEIEGERMTECAKTFCELVRAGGYTPMVYFNQEQGYLYYQLDQLDEFSFWLAEYDEKPDFTMTLRCGSIPTPERYRASRATWI